MLARFHRLVVIREIDVLLDPRQRPLEKTHFGAQFKKLPVAQEDSPPLSDIDRIPNPAAHPGFPPPLLFPRL
jgi:hypothetical protein